jgi:hypothetical protein
MKPHCNDGFCPSPSCRLVPDLLALGVSESKLHTFAEVVPSQAEMPFQPVDIKRQKIPSHFSLFSPSSKSSSLESIYEPADPVVASGVPALVKKRKGWPVSRTRSAESVHCWTAAYSRRSARHHRPGRTSGPTRGATSFRQVICKPRVMGQAEAQPEDNLQD